MKWKLTALLMLVACSAYSQPVWRNFFTTNQNARVIVQAGSNTTVQATTTGVDQRLYTVAVSNSLVLSNLTVFDGVIIGGTNDTIVSNNLVVIGTITGNGSGITNIPQYFLIPGSGVTIATNKNASGTNWTITATGSGGNQYAIPGSGITIATNYNADGTNWTFDATGSLGQTNLALVVSGNNVTVTSVTNAGVTTFTPSVSSVTSIVVWGTNFLYGSLEGSSNYPATWRMGDGTNWTFYFNGTNGYTTLSNLLVEQDITTIGLTANAVAIIASNGISCFKIYDSANTTITKVNWDGVLRGPGYGLTNSAGSYLAGTNDVIEATNIIYQLFQVGSANLTNWSSLPTNVFDWKYQAGSSVLSNLANLDGGQLTNVPFSIWTNYVSNPNDFTNLNGLAFGSGMYGMTSYWAYASAPGIGPIGIYYNGIDTNTVISTNGGAFSGSIVQNNANSQAAPQTNELVTAGWVRNLLTAANLPYYVTTNIDIDATNVGTSQVVYKYLSTIPISFVRSYAVDFLTNNGYLGATITTNTFQELGGSILVAPVVGWAGGSGTRSFSYKAELYVSTDKTNWYGDWSSSIITLPAASTNYTPLVVDVPRTVATNAAGFYLQRRIKITSITFGGSPTAYILGGTNLLTGTADAAHISLPSPTSTAGNAYLAANQGFTGSNTFSGGTMTWGDSYKTNGVYIGPGGEVLSNNLGSVSISAGNTTNTGTVSANGFISPTNICYLALTAGKSYMTNINGNAVLTAFVGVPHDKVWSIYLLATNSTANDYTLTFPDGSRGAGNGTPPVYYVTNKVWAEFQVNGYGIYVTNVNWSPHW